MPSPAPPRAKRAFAIVHIQIGEQGKVRFARIKMSCGHPALDQQAIRELSAQTFALPRVGRKAVAQWHLVRWSVPAESMPLPKR